LFGIFGQFGPDQVPASREHFFAGYRATSERLDGRHVMDGDGLLPACHLSDKRLAQHQVLCQQSGSSRLLSQPCMEFFHAP